MLWSLRVKVKIKLSVVTRFPSRVILGTCPVGGDCGSCPRGHGGSAGKGSCVGVPSCPEGSQEVLCHRLSPFPCSAVHGP